MWERSSKSLELVIPVSIPTSWHLIEYGETHGEGQAVHPQPPPVVPVAVLWQIAESPKHGGTSTWRSDDASSSPP
jgi:hypothetical protein